MADTRKDKRAPVSLKVRFKSATVDEFIEHYSRDVSRGGIFIKSSQPMQIGTLLKFQFQLKDESELIRGVGRVVWVRATEDATAARPAGMGIKFIKMDGESRAVVERIVEAHADEPGAFADGDAQSSDGETPSVRPEEASSGGGGFFPDLPPAELPPPEDRTAVRQAAEFLGAALGGAASDEAFAQEAQRKAEEARQRSAEIEAQREAERAAKRGRQRNPEDPSLPSMIVDPGLADQGEPEAEPAPEGATVTESGRPSAKLRSEVPRESSPSRPSEAPAAPVGEVKPEQRGRSVLLPVVALVAVLAIAAYMVMGDGPKPVSEVPEPEAMEPEVPEPAANEGFGTTVAAEQPEELTVEQAEELAAQDQATDAAAADAALADAAVAAQAPEESAGPPVTMLIRTIPPYAEVLVDGETQPAGRPLRVTAKAGRAVEIVARSRGWLEERREVVPETGMAPVRLNLSRQPWVVQVVTDPPGARVVAGGRRGTSPAELTLAAAPGAPLPVSVKLAGYKLARTTVPLKDFEQTPEQMRVEVRFTLEPLPTPAARKPAGTAPAQAPDKASGAPAAESGAVDAAKADAAPSDSAPEPPPPAAKAEATAPAESE